MQGRESAEGQMVFVVAKTPNDMVPRDHPIRRIKRVVEEVLIELKPLLKEMYSTVGRPSIPPEHLLKGSILMAMFSVRSERQFCEQLGYNDLFKWFLNMQVDDEPFNHSTFSKNRVRLLQYEVADRFFELVVERARLKRLVSDEHFTVDGTLFEAWASTKSFRPIKSDNDNSSEADGNAWTGRNPEVDFHGERRSNQTHRSTTDPEALLAKKGGGPAKLSYAGHLLMENRNGIAVGGDLTQATGRAERDTALDLLRHHRRKKRSTVSTDKGFDTKDFVTSCREMNVTPHVARNTKKPGGSAIDGRTTRHAGYEVSQRKRKLVEEIFGWVKTVGGGRKLRFVSLLKNRLWMLMTVASYNLVRLSKLEAQAA